MVTLTTHFLYVAAVVVYEDDGGICSIMWDEKGWKFMIPYNVLWNWNFKIESTIYLPSGYTFITFVVGACVVSACLATCITQTFRKGIKIYINVETILMNPRY